MKKNFHQLFLVSTKSARQIRIKSVTGLDNKIYAESFANLQTPTKFQTPSCFRNKKFFGGALLYKRRKSQRPLSKKDSIHFVPRSTWAMGPNPEQI